MVYLCSKEALEQLKNDPDWVELPDPFKKLYGPYPTQEDIMRLHALIERLRPDEKHP